MSEKSTGPCVDRPARSSILTLNAGSSSIKFAIFDARAGDDPYLSGLADRIGSDAATVTAKDADGQPIALPEMPQAAGETHETTIAWLLPVLMEHASGTIVASGHRVVHGGTDFVVPAVLDEDALTVLERLVPLARTHQPHALAALRAVGRVWPGVPRIGCFDTAFHSTLSPVARAFALPQWVSDAGVRRYGFHGLSYEWIASRLPKHLGPVADGRVIAAHLGNGASLCGMIARRSQATTMGFTPLDGLMMGERPGVLDPGAVLFMLDEMGLDLAEVRRILFRESGLRGVSGLSNDMRALLASDRPEARFAVDLYVHRAVSQIGAIAAELGGCDALVFTAGVGEHAAPVRARIVEGCGWLGARLDHSANDAAAGGGARVISAADSRVPVWVVPTNEEAVIANATRALAGAA
ncbi:acetate/propionate family kinase [Limibaculum sp. M0105]|uniref:Acetate kinase n=1 Tax=Thermohalobaculum xanthum TaxID=2753746 RepID=A0A8J7M688_9RHOB|nr:acetate/propionate family kinase [Thermohalobaculum xanthum]MBK0399214.1 acetate/propionate family kinase [Thermohalobaculum xanthum]